MSTTIVVAFGLALAIAVVAAVWDWRKGEIPNWLTLPTIVGAPIVHGLLLGPEATLRSAFALICCGLVPFVLFRQQAMGGGDVKLFAALGAVTGGVDVMSGVEIQFCAFIVAMLFTLGLMAWNGQLLRTLGNVATLVLNPLRSKKRKREVQPELMTTVRMGVPILVAACIVCVPTLGKLLVWP